MSTDGTNENAEEHAGGDVNPRRAGKNRQIFGRELPVKLTESERASRGQELAELALLTDRRRSEVKLKIKTLRGSIKALEEDARELSCVVASGIEDRMVECEKVVDFEAGTLTERRMDTGEQIGIRALRPDEMPAPAASEEQPTEEGATQPAKPTAEPEAPTLALIWPAGGKKGEDKAPATATNEDVFNHLVATAIDIIRQTQRASLSSLQRRLRITFNSAGLVMDELERRGIVGPATADGAPREILNLPAEDGAEPKVA